MIWSANRTLAGSFVIAKTRFQIPSIVAVGDTHFPFHDRRWMKWVVRQVKDIQPEYTVQVGDVYDDYNLSRYARSYSVMTPRHEAVAGRRAAEDMWADLKAASPKSKRYQIKGNHDDRASKRLLESAPELEGVVDLDARFEFDGVSTVAESYEELFLGDVAVIHGYKSHGAHARYNQTPTICGHLHRGGVEYFQNRFGTYWELNAGFGGDVDSPVFRYRNQKKIHGWTLGLGVVDEHGPRFMPFH